jgi:hypothetical protein
MTKVQITTVILIIAYIVWEISVQIWAKNQQGTGGAVIRVDLFIIYPLLLIFIIISLYQYFKK